MSDVFIIKNQNDHYLSKSKEWVDGSDANKVYKTEHKDEAINSLVEASSKDFELRGEIITARLSEKGLPQVELLNPIPKDEKITCSEETESSEYIDGAEKAINDEHAA